MAVQITIDLSGLAEIREKLQDFDRLFIVWAAGCGYQDCATEVKRGNTSPDWCSTQCQGVLPYRKGRRFWLG